jgi:molecular chaperone GrpE
VRVDDSSGLAPQGAPRDDSGADSARSTRSGEGADDTGHEEASAGSQPDAAPGSEETEDLALRRALADLDNVRKRCERELARARSLERAAVAAEWLPIVDDLERALDHSDVDGAALLEGVRAVHAQAVALLARLGFPRFDDVGKPFDPHRHEAVGVVDDETAPGTVVGIVRPGYDGLDTVLRPAGVVVSRGE